MLPQGRDVGSLLDYKSIKKLLLGVLQCGWSCSMGGGCNTGRSNCSRAWILKSGMPGAVPTQATLMQKEWK